MPFKSFLIRYKEPAILAVCLALLFKLADFDYDNGVFKYAVQAACLGSALLLALARPETITAWLAPLAPREESVNWKKSMVFGGAAVLLLTLTALEIMSPYYFVQEDTHTIFMPVILHGLRGVFDEGVFPTWNGFNLLGSATTTFGFYALTYPVLYLCYMASRFLLGNEFLTLDMLAWLHLLAGYAFTTLVLRRLGVRSSIAAAASLCFCLLGYNLIAGRSWFYMLPTVAYLPALTLSLITAAQTRVGLRWLLGTALAIGLYFHSGNVQMWCYAMSAWGLGLLWLMASRPGGWRLLYPASAMLAAALALILPLAVPEFLETANLPRFQIDTTIRGGLSNLLLPWPLATAPATWGDYVNPGTLYGTGTVFVLFFFIRCAVVMAAAADARLTRPMAFTLYFPAMAVLAFLLALGSQAHLWDWLSHVMPFSKFRMPFRLLPVAGFFIIVTGALMSETLLRPLARRHAEAVICAAAVLLITFNALACKASFDTVIDRPYPPLPDSQKPLQANGFTTLGRITPIGQTRWYGPGSSLALLLNYPALYRIPVTTGTYIESPEATVPQYRQALKLYRKSPYEFYYEYGVDWIAIAKIAGPPPVGEPAEMSAVRAATKPVDFTYMDGFNIHSPHTKPLAYVESDPATPLPYRILANGVDIDIHHLSSHEDQSVIANFLYLRWMTAHVDGQPVPIRGDAFGRIAADLLVMGDTLSIRYSPPWHKGIIPALLLLLGCITFWRKAFNRQ